MDVGTVVRGTVAPALDLLASLVAGWLTLFHTSPLSPSSLSEWMSLSPLCLVCIPRSSEELLLVFGTLRYTHHGYVCLLAPVFIIFNPSTDKSYYRTFRRVPLLTWTSSSRFRVWTLPRWSAGPRRWTRHSLARASCRRRSLWQPPMCKLWCTFG